MNNILTLPDIEKLIVEKTGLPAPTVNNFLKAIFTDAAKRLTTGETEVDIPGIGRLSVAPGSEIQIQFHPNRNLSEAVNEPFSMFEAVELSDEISPEDLALADAETETLEEIPVAEPEPMDEPAPEPVKEPDAEPEPLATFPEAIVEEPEPISESQPEPQVEPEPEPKTEAKAEPQPAVAPNNLDVTVEDTVYPKSTEPEESEPYYEYPTRRQFNPVMAYILGVLTGIVVSCVAVYIIYPKLMDNSFEALYQEDDYDESEEADEPDATVTTPMPADQSVTTPEPEPTPTPATEPAPTPEVKPTEPAKPTATTKPAATAPVYDTVRPGYFLAKMAKKHYGVEEFWVYIYEENKSKIKNPNQLSNGFKVVIPPAEKYGIDPNNQASVEKAKNKSHELNRKFK